MKKNLYESGLIDSRMKSYLQKIATGPKMSKDLTEVEAEDALSLILKGEVSKVRSAIFLIAARMKLETLEENVGYWKAMDKTTIRHPIQLAQLLQIADPFDGFNRVPYFGFYTIPVLAALGLPSFGHSAPSLPP
jgi:anthranilate phosphoribosyltransferase